MILRLPYRSLQKSFYVDHWAYTNHCSRNIGENIRTLFDVFIDDAED